MAIIPPIPVIRKNLIIRKLKKYGAISPDTAKSFAEIGLVNPNGFHHFTEKLVKKGVIRKTEDGKYFKEV